MTVSKLINTLTALHPSLEVTFADGIEPILIDFDDNPQASDMNTKHTTIDGYSMAKHLVDLTNDDINVGTGNVYIVDTYAHAQAVLHTDKHDMFKAFLIMLKNHGANTIIVIAHNKDLATRKDIPDVDEVGANHLGFKLWMKEVALALPDEPKVKKPAVVLVVKKLRGYQGPRDVYIRHL